ncbi:MAG: hypothetical protein EXR60_01255 [Dehalococcoidia bacterium]|nr:hypothetical protein [Dehalococcoidia bacterium]
MAEEEFKLEYDRSVVGVEYELGTVTITQELLVSYAQSVGEPNPIYWDPEAARRGPHGGLVALPTLCSIYSFNAMNATGPDLKMNFGTTGMDAGAAVETFLPIRPGDVLRVTTKVKDVYAKTGRSGPMVFTINEETFYDQQGRKVAAVTRSGVRR